MDNVHKLTHRDMVGEMTGPEKVGNSVLIDGHVVPNLTMRDHGNEVEFILDGRLAYIFPREVAWLAASFAANAMAVGAGHPSLTSPHKAALPFGTKAVQIES